MKNSNIQWRGSLDELVEKAANFDGRIVYFKNTIVKSKRREQRISTKLAAFTKWINLLEEDLNRAESLDNAAEQEERFRNIYSICLSHQALVDKFLSLKLNPLHSNEVKIQCDRYYTLLHRIGSRNFPEKQALSIHLSDLHSPSTLSQLSLSSLSASETDEDEKHHADHVEMASCEGTSSAYALIQRVLQAKETPEIRLLLSDIDSELNVLADSLNRLNADYAQSLKPLSSAQTDLRKLKELNERRCQLDIACNDLLRKVSGDDLAVIRSFTLHLHSLEEPFMTFLGELQKEIDDEITLQANYEGIAKKLSQLSTDVDQRTRNAIQDVEYVQSDLNLLRTQCSQRRKYVENMLEDILPDAAPSNCSGRKKIMLMVSRTVKTIIQVVEDELRRSSSNKENDLLELKQKLQEVNICIADETDAVDETIPNNMHEQVTESAKKLAEKEQMRIMQSELAKLEEKI
ncbi:unnamed protein product, partial [Onchocerca flexuosa]|uniref:Coiled-coil domain-containing protein 96 n=1 Tax=Onchocerca flexuosa TaxID=387005 RepID=A0A183H823_9BILA